MKLLIIILTLAFSVFSAPEKTLSKAEMIQLTNEVVKDFQIQQFKKAKLAPIQKILDLEVQNDYRACVRQCQIDHGEPRRPDKTNCMKFICDKLGRFGCDDSDELEKVAGACAGTRGSECIEYSCSKLGRFECDDFEELESIAKSCRGVIGNECSQYICSKLSRFECDDNEEIQEVSKACRNNDGKECIEFTCNKLGRFACDDFSELKAIADSCAGRN